MPKGHVIIVCAFPAESKPWIKTFKMQRQHNETNFTRYVNQDNTISLIESGLGKINSAVATATAYQLSGGQESTFFCNIGIAGGPQALGSLFQANKITEQSTKQSNYPFVHNHIKSTAILTVDTADSRYQDNQLNDMEAAGFYQAAARFVAHEQITALKCVSDNNENGIELITPAYATDLLSKHSDDISLFIQKLLLLSNKEDQIINNSTRLYEQLLRQAKFSEYQKQDLKKKTRQIGALSKTQDLQKWECYNVAEDLLQAQEQYIQQLIRGNNPI
jgi:adenosylhomocysteine nucleosidase